MNGLKLNPLMHKEPPARKSPPSVSQSTYMVYSIMAVVYYYTGGEASGNVLDLAHDAILDFVDAVMAAFHPQGCGHELREGRSNEDISSLVEDH